jgi:type I restriction enzyme M protein
VNSEPPEADSFAARIRMLRARLGLSQEQLARRLSVSFATVNRWETGRSRPSARARAAIAELEASAGRGQRSARAEQPAQGQEEAGEQEAAEEQRLGCPSRNPASSAASANWPPYPSCSRGRG